MFLIAAILTFAVFFANVAMGAFTGTTFIGDLGEMLVLLAASIFFVVAILKREADRENRKNG
ncbi:hypothetical protein [Marivita sp. GX14005]|uniref:hypothetical protein n=1 Tax=Marivita sp. GX14005 TaxID=2942276 RepID=UPI002019A61F|nr:hypothetical protein [Marivita sp. GX14005]MCL3882915.1 hypothetical protein [Marivita sp. GX14005]